MLLNPSQEHKQGQQKYVEGVKAVGGERRVGAQLQRVGARREPGHLRRVHARVGEREGREARQRPRGERVERGRELVRVRERAQILQGPVWKRS